MHVRGAVDGDFPELRRIFKDSRCFAFPWIPPGTFHLLDFDEQTTGERIYVAETAENRIGGFLSLWQEDNFIHHLYVDPWQTGRGIGTCLLNSLPEWGRRIFTLKCLARNQDALRFYKKRGFYEMELGESSAGAYWLMRSATMGEQDIDAADPQT